MSKALDAHLKILRAARDGTLPNSISPDNADFSFDALRELCGSGLMEAQYVASLTTADCEFKNSRITWAGRQYLKAEDRAWFQRLLDVETWKKIIVALALAVIGYLFS